MGSSFISKDEYEAVFHAIKKVLNTTVEEIELSDKIPTLDDKIPTKCFAVNCLYYLWI